MWLLVQAKVMVNSTAKQAGTEWYYASACAAEKQRLTSAFFVTAKCGAGSALRGEKGYNNVDCRMGKAMGAKGEG